MVIRCTESSWRPVSSGTLQESILGPVLSSILMIWVMGQSRLSESWMTKVGGVADTPGGHAAIQRDLHRPEKWADGNLVQFNEGKNEVLHLGRNKPTPQEVLGAVQLGSSWAPREGPGHRGGHQAGHE